MDGRYNKKTGIFEIYYENKWTDLNDENWPFVIKKISVKFLTALCYDVMEPFKERALAELKRRIRCEFDLKSLWDFFSNSRRSLGDLALNEIYERSGKQYMIPQHLNR